MMVRIWAVAVGLATVLLTTGVHAADAEGVFAARAAPAGLPPNALARSMLDAEPRVVQARHALEAARLRAGMLEAGSYEWTARASAQRRRFQSGAGDVNEWSVGVERPVRIGGKAQLDRRLGEAQVRLAEARLGEARHEAARELLDLWLAWVATDRARSLWEEQISFARTSLQTAQTRRRAGDASLLEENAARADLAELQRQASSAANEAAKASARLRSRFPQLTQQQPTTPAEPLALAIEDALWRERILAESEDLRIAQEDLQRAEIAAARAGAERLADPTVGVHATSELGGAERVVGFTISIPLGGNYRNLQQREALAQAEVARAALDRVQRELESDIAEALADAHGSLQRWRFAEQSRAATQDNAQLTQRAYTLGEADLQSVLLARRQRVEAALGAAQARADALKASWRLLVDAHLIWELHDE